MASGSLINHLMDNSLPPAPEVGMGATECCWSDRHPYTIITVVNTRKIIVQADKAIRTDKNGMSEDQVYEYKPDLNGSTYVLTLHKNGKWIRMHDSMNDGNPFSLGHRSEYRDFSF